MTKPTLNSSDSLPILDNGGMDSLWRPSWLHWLIAALSGTVEIEKQTAWLRKHNEELRRSNEEAQIAHEQRMKELRQENAKLSDLESKLDAVLPKYNFSLTPPTKTEEG